MALTSDGLLVANRDSGTVLQISTDRSEVTFEQSIASRLSDLAVLSADRIVATDPERNEVILLGQVKDGLQLIDRQSIAMEPMSIEPLDEGRFTIGSRWAREISQWEIRPAGTSEQLFQTARLSLPFAPRKQCLSPDGSHLFVADAFGPYLAVIDLAAFQLKTIFRIPGHNIRGLTISQDRSELLITHQLLNEHAPTSRNHVFWGNVISNIWRSLPLAKLQQCEAAGPIKIHGTLFPLGEESHAAGDPSDIAVTSQGEVLITLAGTSEVSYRQKHDRTFRRLPTGRGPEQILIDETRNVAWIANRFDDSVSVFTLDAFAEQERISLGPSPPLSPVERGEILFHDARLSLDGWFSCHSCHTDGHTADLVNDNFGDDSFGAAKRIPTLLGTGTTAPWGWNGKQFNLSSQVRKSIYLTMRGLDGKSLREENVLALTAFLQDLPPAPSLAKAQGKIERVATEGRKLFELHGCAECHVPPSYTSRETYDVGLADVLGERVYNPPSLLGVSQRSAFLHDGRARKLSEVFSIHQHPNGTTWSDNQVEELVRFLKTL